MPHKLPVAQRNALVGAIITWLNTTESVAGASSFSSWSAATWDELQTLLFIQGIAPYFQHVLSTSTLYAKFPLSLRTWLGDELARNRARVQLLHEEAGAILRSASCVGIAMMPLKGILLSTTYYSQPALRPMADLDFLVRPSDFSGTLRILQDLGYRLPVQDPERKRRSAIQARLIHPQAATVVSITGEHPNNPRPVEIHTIIRTDLWSKPDAYDLTAMLWRNCYPGELFGEPVLLPSIEALFTHIAIHAFRHFLLHEGRMQQWLDLAMLAPHLPYTQPLQPAHWVYPIVCFAARALPNYFDQIRIQQMAQGVQPWLQQWAQSTPLDARCGLNIHLHNQNQRIQTWIGWLTENINYWRPTRLRLALYAADASLSLAYYHYVCAVGKHVLALTQRSLRSAL